MKNVLSITILFGDFAGHRDDSSCNVIRKGSVAVSYFTHILRTSSGTTKTVNTLQEAAASCREAGSDIIHYAQERGCWFTASHKFATRDMNASPLSSYQVVCQRK